MIDQSEMDRMAAELDGITRGITPGSADDIYAEAAVEIARAALLEVDRYRRVEAQLRVLCESDSAFGGAELMRLAADDPDDAPPVLCVAVVDVLRQLDREAS